MNFFRLNVIVGPLPNVISNGQLEDAVPVMANLNWIINQVNANAQAAGLVALLNAANSFTQVQSGIAATSPANFPIASQVQNQSFNTLSSVSGSNAIVGRVAALAITGYTVGETFTWQGTGRNSGAATLDAGGGAGAIQSGGQALAGGELGSGTISVVTTATTPVFELMIPPQAARNALITAKGDVLSGTSVARLGKTAAGIDGAVWASFSSEVSGIKPMFLGSGVAVGPGNSLAANIALSSTQVTGTSGQFVVVSSVQQQHPSACKAWGISSGTPPTAVGASYPTAGVSVSKSSAGVFVVTHGVTFPTTSYVPVISASGVASLLVWNFSALTATTFTVSFTDTANVATDPAAFTWAVFGKLAIPT